LKLIPLESNFTPALGPAVLGQSRLWHCIRSCYW